MPEIDKELTAALKKAKTRHMAFAFVLKGTEGKLMVGPKVAAAQITELKKEAGGGTSIKGQCFGEESLMVFFVAKEPPGTLEAALRKAIHKDTGMSMKVEVRVRADAENDPSDAPLTPPQPTTETGKHALGPREFGTLRLAWDTARKKVEGELKDLEKAILADFQGDEDFQEITAAVRKLDKILQTLTEELSDKLDDAMNNEGEKRAALQKQSAVLADRYLAYVNGDPLIKDLNENPFHPVTIGKTLTTTLTLISQKLRG